MPAEKMVSTAGAIARRHGRLLAPAPQQLRAVVGFAALSLLVFLAVVFAARRLAGELAQPLDGASLIGAAVGIAVLAVGSRTLIFAWPPLGNLRLSTKYSVLSAQYSILGTAAIAAAALLAALIFPDSLPSAVLIAWFILAVAEAATWRLAFPRKKPARLVRPTTAQPPLTAESEAAESIPANMLQQVTRVHEADGSESLHALARAEVPAGDRLAVVHLALCPPLDSPPELTAYAIDSDNAEVRITTAETYGVRLEVRLAQTAPEARQVLVEMLGRASAADSLGGDLG